MKNIVNHVVKELKTGFILFFTALWFTVGELFEITAWKMGVLTFAVQKEIWVKYLIGNLFKNNKFLEYCHKEDEYVLDGKVVHIPQAGDKPGAQKNRTKLPATVHRRKDVDVTYPLDEFTTDPMLIPNADQVELSYNKIDSILSESSNTLFDLIADWLLYEWAAEKSDYIIRTSGGADETEAAATAPGSTGNRLILVKEDLRKARTIMNVLNIPERDRYAILPSNMADQLLDDSDLLKRDGAMELNLKEGIITRLYGFNLMDRSRVLSYTDATTPARKEPGAGGGANDNEAIICYQKDQVARALGTVDFFEDLKNPQFYGDIYSALIRMGGRKRRQNDAGVVSIVQAKKSS